MSENLSSTATNAIRRRNLQAARIAKLEEQLWLARTKLDDLDRAVYAVQQAENLTVRYGKDDQWSWVV
jgi:hypothetical protein